MYTFKINNKKYESADSKINGSQILKIAGLQPETDYELLIKVNEKGFEPVELTEVIDLESPGIEGFFVSPYEKIIIYVDDEPLNVTECFMTPTEILIADGKKPEGFYLKQIVGHKEIGYKNDREHKIAIKNGLMFTTCKLEPATVS